MLRDVPIAVFGKLYRFDISPVLPQFARGDTDRYPPFVSGLHIVSEYAKGFRYMKAMARAGQLDLETPFDENSQFAKQGS